MFIYFYSVSNLILAGKKETFKHYFCSWICKFSQNVGFRFLGWFWHLYTKMQLLQCKIVVIFESREKPALWPCSSDTSNGNPFPSVCPASSMYDWVFLQFPWNVSSGEHSNFSHRTSTSLWENMVHYPTLTFIGLVVSLWKVVLL